MAPITGSGPAGQRYIAFRDGSSAHPSGIGEGNLAFDQMLGYFKTSENSNPYAPLGASTTGWVRDSVAGVVVMYDPTDYIRLPYDRWVSFGPANYGAMTIAGSAVMHLGHTDPLKMPAFIRANVNDSFVVESQTQVCLELNWTQCILGGNGAWVGIRAGAPAASENVTFEGDAFIGGDLWVDDTLLWDLSVNAKTTDYIINATESGRVFTNEGATADITFSLPPAVTGYHYTFIVVDASDDILVDAATGDTIRYGATVTPAGGYVRCSNQGTVITIVAVNNTEWYATSYHGVFATT